MIGYLIELGFASLSLYGIYYLLTKAFAKLDLKEKIEHLEETKQEYDIVKKVKTKYQNVENQRDEIEKFKNK